MPAGAAAGAKRPVANTTAAGPADSGGDLDRKEIRLRAATGAHDLDVKVNKLEAFLRKGHRIKVTLQYRYDEAPLDQLTARLMAVAARLAAVGSIEREVRPEGRRALTLLMAPSKGKAGNRPPPAPTKTP